MTRQHDTTDFRLTWRMANWWQCLITLFFAGGVGWIIQSGLRSTSPDVYGHILAPLYGLALYWTLAALVNRRSVTVTREQLRVTNAPLPLGEPAVRVARSDVEFVFHVPIETEGDSGGTVVLWHAVGVAVKPDRTAIPIFDMVKTVDEARAKAQRIADASAPMRMAGRWKCATRSKAAKTRTCGASPRSWARWPAQLCWPASCGKFFTATHGRRRHQGYREVVTLRATAAIAALRSAGGACVFVM
jgi:hypothetical protein